MMAGVVGVLWWDHDVVVIEGRYESREEGE